MKNRKALKREEIHIKLNQMFHYPLSTLPAGIAWKRLARIVLPVLLALFVIAGLFIPARLAGSQMPQAQNGVLNLADWNRKQAFAVSGQWELYWDCLLSDAQIRSSGQAPILVNAPDKWSYYEIGGVSLPEKGNATYHVHVTGAQAGEVYGVRIKDMKNAYRLYVDGVLVAQNGSFGFVRAGKTGATLSGTLHLSYPAEGSIEIPALDVSSLVNLESLYCAGNLLTTLDVASLGAEAASMPVLP